MSEDKYLDKEGFQHFWDNLSDILDGKHKVIWTDLNFSPSADTVNGWKTSLGGNGAYLTFYNTANKFTKQPSQYGWLKTSISGNEIRQDFYVQTDGTWYYRAGNSTGWFNRSSNDGTFRNLGANLDTSLSTSSANPVTNSAVTTALNSKCNFARFVAEASTVYKKVKITGFSSASSSVGAIIFGRNQVFMTQTMAASGDQGVLYEIGSNKNGATPKTSNRQLHIKVTNTSGTPPYSTFYIAADAYCSCDIYSSGTIEVSDSNATEWNGITSARTSVPIARVSDIATQTLKDGYIEWGGRSVYDNITPDDAGCVDEFGHNKLAFLHSSCITVEYSTDAGETWTDYGLSNADKAKLVTYGDVNVHTGGTTEATSENITNLQVRVRIAAAPSTATGAATLYTAWRKILLNVNSPNSDAVMRMRYRTIANYKAGTETWVDANYDYPVRGGSGWNSIVIPSAWPQSFGGNFGNQTSQIGQFEITLKNTKLGTWDTKKAKLLSIRMIGVTNWNMPSEMARTGRLYEIDTDQSMVLSGKRLKFSGSNYPNISSSTGTLAFSADGNWSSGNHGNIVLTTTAFRPSSNQSQAIDLGAVSGTGMWRNLYMSGGIYHGTYLLTLPNKAGTIAVTDDIPTTMVGATGSSDGSSGLVPAPSAGDNIKYLSGDGTWTTPPTTYSSYLGSSPGTAGYWKKLGNLTFPQHQQGKSVLLKIILGFGNNGTNAQQAFVDLVGQLGWTGSYSGRAGWTASYNKMNTGKSVNNFDIKVIANSVLDYDVYIRATGTYMSVTPVFIPGINNDGTENAIWTPDYSNWTQDAPSGTECDIAKIGVAIGDIPTKVSDLTSDVGGNSYTGTCSTAAATAAKEVTISSDQNFVLNKGAVIGVKFTYTNTAQNPTLNVNGTGAKSIWFNTAAITTDSLNRGGYANRYTYYIYDGTYWVWLNWGTDDNTTYSSMSVAEGTAGTATSQRVVRADYLKQIIQSYVPSSYAGSLITDNSITFDKTVDGEFLKLETTTTDPGEGSALDDNTLLAVYDVPDDYKRGEILVSTQNVDTLATTSNVATIWSNGTWTQFGRMASSSNKHILTIANPTSNAWTVEISLDCPSVLPGSVISGSSIITTTPATGIAELDSNNAISKVITWSRIASRGSVYNRKYVTIPANTTKKFCACVCTYQTSASPTGTWEGGDEITGTAVGAGFGGPSCTLTATLIDNGE